MHVVAAVAAGVRRGLGASLYDEAFRSLSPRECRYVLTLAALGAGPHAIHEIADALGTRAEQISSIRTQLLKKSIVYVPAVGLVDFRIPLTERYIAEHRDELQPKP